MSKWLFDESDILDFNLYLEGGELFIPKSSKISHSLIEEFKKIDKLYIRQSDLEIYNRFIERIVTEIARDKKVSILKKASVIYHQASEILDDMFENPEELENVSKSKKVVDNFVGTILSDSRAIESLIAITSYDYYTHTHSINVSIYALCLGSYLGFSDSDITQLGQAALMHDLGKSKIDPAITNKNGKLTTSEFNTMKLHTVHGHSIALKLGIKESKILDAIRHHHEKLNGTGYPDGLSGRNITLFPRIIAICDIFDALSTKRSYKDRLSSFDTLMLMKRTMQDHIDMDLLNAFIRMQRPTI